MRITKICPKFIDENMIRTALCVSCLLSVALCQRVNYCGARMCGGTDSHTFCQYSPGPSTHCTGFLDATLTTGEKSRLLARLNRRRNEAAGGRLRSFPSAGNMLKLRWIEELAQEAQLWADQCRPPSIPEARDECRDLYSITVGQCVASVVGEAPGLHVESLVDMWYMQSLLYKGNVTSYVPPVNPRHFYGDFAQMMWARSYMVGCGRSRFMVPWQGRLRSVERLVCNMSPAGPAPGRALWSPAAAASVCPPRSNPDHAFTALCNYQLEMDVSDKQNKMTIEEHVLLTSVLEIERNETTFDRETLDELYLTNLAIVTMEDVGTSTKLYNSIQKRDIIEEIDIANTSFSAIRDTPYKHEPFNSLNHDKNNKKRLSTIGRPKSYNMADLTEVGGDQNDINYEATEEKTKSINDIYGEYSIVDTTEGNKMNDSEVANIEPKLDGSVWRINDTFHKSIIIRTDTNIIDEENRNESSSVDITDAVISSTAEYTFNTSQETQHSEDYLTDTETVRQLQEALDRMEDEKQIPRKTAIKVRRELRETTELPIIVDTNGPEEDHNTTEDRSPMIGMVLKYMPYLKEYEGNILGTKSSAVRLLVSSSVVIVICLHL